MPQFRNRKEKILDRDPLRHPLSGYMCLVGRHICVYETTWKTHKEPAATGVLGITGGHESPVPCFASLRGGGSGSRETHPSYWHISVIQQRPGRI